MSIKYQTRKYQTDLEYREKCRKEMREKYHKNKEYRKKTLERARRVSRILNRFEKPKVNKLKNRVMK